MRSQTRIRKRFSGSNSLLVCFRTSAGRKCTYNTALVAEGAVGADDAVGKEREQY